MTKTEIRYIAEDLVDELREMQDGTEITSWQLLKAGGYDPQELDFSELMDYHQYLLRIARANHITLDMSKHEGKVEGLPYNLDFVVRNKKAQIKCPYCGSKNIKNRSSFTGLITSPWSWRRLTIVDQLDPR